jgi:hypothetical protein
MSERITTSAPAVLLLAGTARFPVCFAAFRRRASFVVSVCGWQRVTDRIEKAAYGCLGYIYQ